MKCVSKIKRIIMNIIYKPVVWNRKNG